MAKSINNGKNTGNTIMNIADPQYTTQKHYELIDKFILNDYPEIAKAFNNYTALGVQIRPIIVGGSAYRIHMIKSGVSKEFKSLLLTFNRKNQTT